MSDVVCGAVSKGGYPFSHMFDFYGNLFLKEEKGVLYIGCAEFENGISFDPSKFPERIVWMDERALLSRIRRLQTSGAYNKASEVQISDTYKYKYPTEEILAILRKEMVKRKGK